MSTYERVPARVVLGPNGYKISRGYTIICGARRYDSFVAVGPRGQPTIIPAKWEFNQ